MELSQWHMWWKKSGAAGLGRILMREWNPIGVDGVPEAADEYDSYVGVIGERLRRGATPDELASYLTDVRENRMGLGSSLEGRLRDQRVASRLGE